MKDESYRHSSFILHPSSLNTGAPFRSARSCCRELRLVGADVDLDAPVELAAVGRAVRGAGLCLAVADGIDAGAVHAQALEVGRHRIGATLGEPLVVRLATDGIGVTADS